MTDVTFIGTSDAFGAGGRRQSAVLVRAPEGGLLLDCGSTTLTGMAELGIERGEVDTIIVSHFHADHFGGIPLMLFGMLYEDHRKAPLRIAGPPEIADRVRAASAALGHPLDKRDWSFEVRFEELRPGKRSSLGPVDVHSFETHHNPDAHPQGYVVRAGSRRIAYSGDTGWFDQLPKLVRGSNLFICECTQLERGFEYHLSLEELTERQSAFDVDDLVLTHLGHDMAQLRGRCEFETADDGLVIRV